MAQIAASARLGLDVPIADDVTVEPRCVIGSPGQPDAATARAGAPG